MDFSLFTKLQLYTGKIIFYLCFIQHSCFVFFQLDSDQESTDGEDSVTQSGEPLGVLEPNRLLFRASRVHNVPLMCQAIALGKDHSLYGSAFYFQYVV